MSGGDLVELAERFVRASAEVESIRDAMKRLLLNGGGGEGPKPNPPPAARPGLKRSQPRAVVLGTRTLERCESGGREEERCRVIAEPAGAAECRDRAADEHETEQHHATSGSNEGQGRGHSGRRRRLAGRSTLTEAEIADLMAPAAVHHEPWLIISAVSAAASREVLARHRESRQTTGRGAESPGCA